MLNEPCLRHGYPLAHHLCFTADRGLTLHQRRSIRRAVRDTCLLRRWHLIASDVSRHRVQAVIGGRVSGSRVHRLLFELCSNSRPLRDWDTAAPVALYDESDILEACTRTFYEETSGLIGEARPLFGA